MCGSEFYMNKKKIFSRCTDSWCEQSILVCLASDISKHIMNQNRHIRFHFSIICWGHLQQVMKSRLKAEVCLFFASMFLIVYVLSWLNRWPIIYCDHCQIKIQQHVLPCWCLRGLVVSVLISHGDVCGLSSAEGTPLTSLTPVVEMGTQLFLELRSWQVKKNKSTNTTSHSCLMGMIKLHLNPFLKT